MRPPQHQGFVARVRLTVDEYDDLSRLTDALGRLDSCCKRLNQQIRCAAFGNENADAGLPGTGACRAPISRARDHRSEQACCAKTGVQRQHAEPALEFLISRFDDPGRVLSDVFRSLWFSRVEVNLVPMSNASRIPENWRSSKSLARYFELERAGRAFGASTFSSKGNAQRAAIRQKPISNLSWRHCAVVGNDSGSRNSSASSSASCSGQRPIHCHPATRLVGTTTQNGYDASTRSIVRPAGGSKRELGNSQRTPLISIVMHVSDPPTRMLDEAIRSVRHQLYPHWELCIEDCVSTNKAVSRLIRKHAKKDHRIKRTAKSRRVNSRRFWASATHWRRMHCSGLPRQSPNIPMSH